MSSILTNESKPIMKISVVGVGTAGSKAIEIIPKDKFQYINFLYANTSNDELIKYDKNSIILLNGESTETIIQNESLKGKISANNSIEQIKEKLLGTQILILTAGFGGTVGSGALPVISKIAKEMGIITIAIVTTPFSYEGVNKEILARQAIDELKRNADSFIVISNNRLINNYPDIAATDAFKLINNILKNCIKTFIELISRNSTINLSISDLLSVIKNKGESYIGFGNGIGKNKISRAINKALDSKIIETSYKNATNALLNIVGDPSVTMNEIKEIIEILKHKTKNPKLNVVFSFNANEKMRNEIQLSLIVNFDKNGLNTSKSVQDDKLHHSQELLLQIGNTLENELNGYATGELDLQFNKEEIVIDDKGQNEYLITSEISEEDDDIPFFLK